MSNATIRTIVGTSEVLVLLFLICLSVALAMVQAQRNPAARKLAHVTLMMRIVGLSALAFGSVLIPSGYSGFGAASIATGVVLLVGAALAWSRWQDANANRATH